MGRKKKEEVKVSLRETVENLAVERFEAENHRSVRPADDLLRFRVEALLEVLSK